MIWKMAIYLHYRAHSVSQGFRYETGVMCRVNWLSISVLP